MNAKQINWFRNRKSQKRAETAIGSDGKRHRNQSRSLSQNRLSECECESESRRAHQFNSIRHQAYTSTKFSLATHELYNHPQLHLSCSASCSPSRFFSCSCSCSTLPPKKEIKCGRHVATLLLIWQTDGQRRRRLSEMNYVCL